ncbi:MAG TPA: JAB domain-containing protein [Oscillospiraceae bacterium]|nr:JAB domain-containing protein [Oscillospiraceae bacterium]HPS34579.1 JAB domain-containing protein [Oscillospiraceae bacterium]
MPDAVKSPHSAVTHGGHRKRLRDRFLRQGAHGLYDHELLELLLFYAYKRVDVNPAAHKLIKEAGGLDKLILDAGERVGKTGELLSLCSAFTQMYYEDKCDCIRGMRNFNSPSLVTQYAPAVCTEPDLLRVMCLDAKMSLKNLVTLKNNFEDAAACFHDVFLAASTCAAAHVIILLCHGDGNPSFTRPEISVIGDLRTRFSHTAVRLADVVLCCDGRAIAASRYPLLSKEDA